MPPSFQFDTQLAINHWSDQLGKITAESLSDSPGFRICADDNAPLPRL